MAEIVSKVYDIVYPSPILLRDLSLFAVVVQIWRWELQQYGPEEVMEKLYPKRKPTENISLSEVIPKLPSTIDCMIKKCHKKLMASIHQWLEYNFRYIFGRYRDNPDDILKDFSDIVCDCDGTVHYDRTAKRMLRCDRISQDEKFEIACVCSFEDDIRQLWSSVETKIDLNEIYFGYFPHLYYWVCHIRNELHKIPDLDDDESIEETMLECDTRSRSTFEYFWNGLSVEKQCEITLQFYAKEATVQIHIRYILPKLNEQQLAEFLNNWFYYLIKSESNRNCILPIWMRIKNNTEDFFSMVQKLLWVDSGLCIAEASTEQASHNDEILTICCDIWNSAPDHLKRATMKHIFDNNRLLNSRNWKSIARKEMRFLLIVLSDATLEERSIFWHNNWLDLLKSTRLTDFIKIMELCLNEQQIGEFKETTLSKYENIEEVIDAYFDKEYFQQLEDLVNLCCPDQRSRRILYWNVLQSNTDFLKCNEIFNKNNIRKMELLRKFVDFIRSDDLDISRDFNIDLATLFLPNLSNHMTFSPLNNVILFIDTYAPLIQNVDEIKKGQFVETLRNYINSGFKNQFDGEEVRKFLFWCLGKEDENEMMKFKQSISSDLVLHNMLEFSKQFPEVDFNTYEWVFKQFPAIDSFLCWYFDTSEEIDEFKIKFAAGFK